MSSAAIVAIVVAAGEAQSPSTVALLTAANEALGSGLTLRVFEASPPSDDAALEVESDLEARAVVTLVWRDPSRLRAHTRLHVARTDRWTDREIAFAPADTLTERGRALGFAIASMFPEAEAAARRLSRPRPVEVVEGPPPEPVGPIPRHALGLGAVGAAGLGGPAAGLGAAVHVVLLVRESLGFRGGLLVRQGDLQQLGGAGVVQSLALGAGWWPLVPAPGRRPGMGLRADLLIIREQVSRSREGGAESSVHSLPGADIVAEGALRLVSGLELAVGIGLEIAFGKTHIIADGENLQDIPVLRAVGEAGLRYRF